MSFNEGAQLDTSQVESGGGGGAPGGMVVGGGLGGIILLIIALIFGINPADLPGSGTDPGQTQPGQVEAGGNEDPNAFSECKTGADANRNDQCRVIGTVNSANAYWSAELPRYGREYTPAKTVLYSGTTQSACGTASNQVGPFYCPLDQKVYIDADFFQILSSQFGADDGALAQEYVVAHEYGHHIQNLYGYLDRIRTRNGPMSDAVRSELQADCLAGIWTNHATTVPGRNGKPLITELTQDDIERGLDAAAAVGDDRIQQKTQGQVNPESFSHGTAEQRMRWFSKGKDSGDMTTCDTWSADTL
jgi:hypothetical protein